MRCNAQLALTFALASASILAGATAACSSSATGAPTSTADSGVAPSVDGGASDTLIDGVASSYAAEFADGFNEFNRTLGEQDGLGPLYTEAACSSCHGSAARGPGLATKMAVVGSDGVTPLVDQSLLPFGDTEHPKVVTNTGARTPILPPWDGGIDGGANGAVSVRVTLRIGPPLYGRGYMEAVEDSEIERMESQQANRTDGIRGHANHIAFASQPNPDSTFDSHRTGDMVIGRFGLKARIATLDEFAADALQNDIGITSPMRPSEFANPDGVTDDLKPGVDVTADQMNARAMYTRLLAIPARTNDTGGRAWFEQCSCNVCHAESLHTSSSYPIAQLADIDAPIYTDMLLHDMGDNLSDSITGGTEGQAGPRDWRTAPLMGVALSTSFMHDGRASNINDAILAHDGPGSEAAGAVACYRALGQQQQVLVDFVNGL